MAIGRASTWVSSPRTLLAVSALADGLLRLPEDLIAPLVSITGGLFGNPRVGFVTTWFLFYVALYNFAHLAYGHLDTDVTEVPRNEFGFQIIFATTGVALGMAIQQFADQSAYLLLVIPGVFAAGGIFLGYLSACHSWDLTDPQGKGVAILELFTPHEDVSEEIESDLGYEGWLGHLGATFYLLALAVVFGFPAALAALVLQILVYSFPVPDVLFFGWAVSARFFPRVSVGPSRERVLDLGFDLEEFLVSVIEQGTRSVQGLLVTIFALLGVFLSAGYLLVAVSVTPQAIEAVVTGIRLLPSGVSAGTVLPVWNILGALVLLFLAGSYGIWVWIRELQRLPHFLDTWEERTTESESQPVTRVYGFVGVPVVALGTTAVMVTVDTQPVAIGYALAWPVILGGGLWTIHQTRRRRWQHVTTEHRWVYAGLVVQTVTLWIGTSLPRLADAVAGTWSLASLLGVPVGVTVLLTLVAAIPTIDRYEKQFDDIRRYSLVGLLLVLGALAAVGSVVVPSNLGIFAIVLAAVCLGFGLLLGIVRYYGL